MYLRIFKICVLKYMNLTMLVVLLHQDKTKVRLDFITDIDMLLLVEKGIRGGIWNSIHRYAKTNNKHNFRSINSLPTTKIVNQCINTITFKFVTNTCPYYLEKIVEFSPHCRIDTRNKFSKFKIPFRKTKMGQKAISVVGRSLWNSLRELIKKQII